MLMPVNYARLNATAQRLIDENGKGATLYRDTQTGPDHNPTVTTTTYAVRMVETGYSITNRNETLINAGDKVGMISSAGEAPQMSDKIEIDGTKYSFADLKPLNPGGTVLLYEFVATR